MDNISILDGIEEHLMCECGSIFFDEFNAKTFIDSQFISYGPNSALVACDRTVPIVKCIFCNKVHIPRTSFAGRNVLDRTVQIYAELLRESEFFYSKKEEVVETKIEDKVSKEDVQTESDSTTSNQDVIQQPQKRSTTRKTNKK